MAVDEELKASILENLSEGKANAIMSHILERRLGLERERTAETVRRAIREMVLEGHLIGSCRDGFYLISNREELEENVAHLQGRIRRIQQRIRALRRSFDRKEK